jgi:rhodanese-related sulfurtransferase
MTAAATGTLSSTDLRDLLDSADRALIVDVRTPAEFETAHIPGSYNVPLDVLRARGDDARERVDGDVVLVCRSGRRSTQAQQVLNSAGVSAARVLRDGILDWEKQGYAVDRATQRWDLERHRAPSTRATIKFAVSLGIYQADSSRY